MDGRNHPGTHVPTGHSVCLESRSGEASRQHSLIRTNRIESNGLRRRPQHHRIKEADLVRRSAVAPNSAGEMAEWLKAHAWKACLGETLTWVRIPLSPPVFPPNKCCVRVFLQDEAEWIARVPPVPKIKIMVPPTMPLTEDEYTRLLDTIYGTIEGKERQAQVHALQLMRWSGLAMCRPCLGIS